MGSLESHRAIVLALEKELENVTEVRLLHGSTCSCGTCQTNNTVIPLLARILAAGKNA